MRLTRAPLWLPSGANEQSRSAGDPASSRADRRFLLTDVLPSSQTPARACTRLSGDGATSGDSVDPRCDGGDCRWRAADSRRGTSHSRETGDHRGARCQERARGGRHPIPVGRNVTEYRVRLLGTRPLGLRQGGRRGAAQLVRALEHGSRGGALEDGRRRRTRVLRLRARGSLSRERTHGACAIHRKNRRDRGARKLELRFSSRRCAARRSRITMTTREWRHLARGLPKFRTGTRLPAAARLPR